MTASIRLRIRDRYNRLADRASIILFFAAVVNFFACLPRSVALPSFVCYNIVMKAVGKSAANLILFAVTLLWGGCFVVSKYAVTLGATAGWLSFLRGGIFLLFSVVFFFPAIRKMRACDAGRGLIAGVSNSLAFLFQTIAIEHTTPSVTGFLTILHIVFVPLISLVLFRKKLPFRTIPAVVVALVGAFILSGVRFTDFRLGLGELMAFLSAVAFGVSIAYLGNGMKDTDPKVTAFWMALTQTIGGAIYMLAFERAVVPQADWVGLILPLLYLGVLGSFITTSAQTFCQKHTDAVSAALIMAMEAVFGSVISLIVGYDRFSTGLAVGGVLILIGAAIAIVPGERWMVWKTIAAYRAKQRGAASENDKSDDQV